VVLEGQQASVDVKHLEINSEFSLTLMSQHRELSFQISIVKGALDATPQDGVFTEWSIVTDPANIDGANGEGTAETEVLPDELANDALEFDNEPEELDDLGASDILQYGQALNTVDTPPLALSLAHPPSAYSQVPLPIPGLLEGYGYTEFKPKPYDHSLPKHSRSTPSQAEVLKALQDIKQILHLDRNTGWGFKDPQVDLWCHAQLEEMLAMLNMFTNKKSLTYDCWGASACQTLVGMGRG
jgi:hypothetical protein